MSEMERELGWDDEIEKPYEGDTKDSVVCNANINPTVAMQKLYCTTYVN